MSKSKYGNSNLYMTPVEFSNLIVEVLDEQNYFKKNEAAHPADICVAFSSAAETIGKAMDWAIKNESGVEKQAVMKSGNLRKGALPIDEEIAPTGGDYDSEYSEWKHQGYM